jgi:IMP dehydrogenase
MAKSDFFDSMERQGVALTYDDVRLKTGHSLVAPNEVTLGSRFSRNVPLNLPIVSSAMDTVTEWPLAVEIAKLGGLGIIHRGLEPQEQASHVKRVKFFLNGLIDQPIVVRDDDTIESIEQLRASRDWPFHSFPVINKTNKLVGLLTRNDFDFNDDPKRIAKSVMSKNLITAPEKTTLDEAYAIMSREKKKILPLVNSKKELKGLYVFSDVERIKNGSLSDYNVDADGRLRVGAAVGTGAEALKRVKLMAHRVDVIVIDTAHGDSAPVYKTLKAIKKAFPELDVVVGNVSEGDSAKRLAAAGADGIKVGQGPGSICTTRVVAGIGCPQVTAIYNCVKALEGTDVPVCADGGISQSGDIPIALGVGAHSVMLGRLLAGTKEAPGQIVMHQGNRVKVYRGMGSLGAMMDSRGARERYSQRDTQGDKLVPEGVEGLVPYRGTLSELMVQYIGGLRAGMGYVGATNIDDLREKGDFYRITGAGVRESHPHDIVITADAPNYHGGRAQ